MLFHSLEKNLHLVCSIVSVVCTGGVRGLHVPLYHMYRTPKSRFVSKNSVYTNYAHICTVYIYAHMHTVCI